MNGVCTRLPVFSSLISYGNHQHWRMPRHGNIGQFSLSLCPWALHSGCSELHSVEGSPQILCVPCRHVTNNLTKPNPNQIIRTWFTMGALNFSRSCRWDLCGAAEIQLVPTECLELAMCSRMFCFLDFEFFSSSGTVTTQ